MADAAAEAAVSDAWAEALERHRGRGTAGARALGRAVRGPWVLAVLITAVAVLGLAGATQADTALQAQRAAAIARAETLELALNERRQANADAVAAAEALREMLRDQLAALASTEGFLR